MKNYPMSYCRAFLAVLGMLHVPALAHAQSPHGITSPVEKIFIPDGFDDNDNVEVVLQGSFPSTCYKVGKTSSVVNTDAKVIEITATSYKYDGESRCNEVEVPFIQKVKLGVLEKGVYKIHVRDVPAAAGVLPVASRHTEAPDDYHYAPVANVVVTKDLESSRQMVVLEGHFPFLKKGCMVLTEVRTHLTPSNVLVVLPITEIREGEACNNVPTTRVFRIEKEIEAPLDQPTLVHVRVLNGDSLNQFVPGRT